jgi:hypothetical protein
MGKIIWVDDFLRRRGVVTMLSPMNLEDILL